MTFTIACKIRQLSEFWQIITRLAQEFLTNVLQNSDLRLFAHDLFYWSQNFIDGTKWSYLCHSPSKILDLLFKLWSCDHWISNRRRERNAGQVVRYSRGLLTSCYFSCISFFFPVSGCTFGIQSKLSIYPSNLACSYG